MSKNFKPYKSLKLKLRFFFLLTIQPLVLENPIFKFLVFCSSSDSQFNIK